MANRHSGLNYYNLYGSTIAADLDLDLPVAEPAADVIRLQQGLTIPRMVQNQWIAGRTWFESARAPGFYIMSWQGVADFAVRDDGLEIHYNVDGRTPWAVVQAYLLNQVLSQALLQRGRDALHGVACEAGGKAFLFVGGSGFGKSTLLSQLLLRGLRFVSDDLLVLSGKGNSVSVCRGLSRMKLYPDAIAASGIAFDEQIPMNPYTDKSVCFLSDDMVAQKTQLPVAGIYVIDQTPSDTVCIRSLVGIEKFTALASNIFNSLETDLSRSRVGFNSIHSWSGIPVWSLSYPRNLKKLPSLADRLFEEFDCTK